MSVARPTVRWLQSVLLCLVAMFVAMLSLASTAWAQVKAPPAKAAADKAEAASKSDPYIRVLRDDKKRPIALQTSVVHYTSEKDPKLTVDLIGAVHVGDHSYYDELNKRFTKYGALLYELVASPEKKVPQTGKKSNHPIGMMQHGMKDVLELEHQLDLIDYKRPNFVHADMSPAEFDKAMADRNESIWTMMFRMMGQGIAMQGTQANNGSEMKLLMAFFDSNRSLALKRAMAEQFEMLEGHLDALEGPNGSAIITDRNQKALKVLGEQIDAGQRNLGIFYGAGHLADLDKHLVKDFGLKRQGTEWITAWKLTSSAKTTKPAAKKRGAE
ncbi:MAG: hypothetical protein JSS27_19150 [Planctomycetes bacterium]|nr:hypothetical protein [Planctomycetota bacterium]